MSALRSADGEPGTSEEEMASMNGKGGATAKGGGMTGRMVRAAIACALAVLACLAFAAAASAEIVHEEVGTFAKLDLFDFVAVDNSSGAHSGDLYLGVIYGALNSSTKKFEYRSKVLQESAAGSATGVELDGAETPAGSFDLIDQATFQYTSGPAVAPAGANAGEVYVPDIVHGVVDVFNEAGRYVCQITGKATPSSSECAKSAGSRTPTGALEPMSVAVSPANGEVAVGNATGVIYIFNQAGEYVEEIAGSGITHPFGLAFNKAGELYVVNALNPFSGGEAFELAGAGGAPKAIAKDRVSVGVDLSSAHVYFGGPYGTSEIQEFNAAGRLISTFGALSKHGADTVAVDASTKEVYLTPVEAAENEIWSGDRFIPDVTTGEAADVGETTATLHGEVEPEVSEGGSEVTSCEVQYIDAAGYEKAVTEHAGDPYAAGGVQACAQKTPYAGATAVSAALTGLSPSTSYHYRVVAENAAGEVGRGEDATFTTFGPAAVAGEWAKATTTKATIHGEIDPFGYETSCEMQYVSDAQFAASGYAHPASVPCVPSHLAAGFSYQSVDTATLEGLKIDSAYHYRFVATNAGGTTVGEDRTFVTFGIASFSFDALNQAEEPFSQAGGHPYELADAFTLNTSQAEHVTGGNPPQVEAGLDANPKDIITRLPSGLIGNPDAVPKCSGRDFTKFACSGVSQIGVLRVIGVRVTHKAPLFNLTPPKGLAAQFGAEVESFATVHIDARVRTGGDYGVTAEVTNISTQEAVFGSEVILWGVPADPGHDPERYCPKADSSYEHPCSAPERGPLVPFLTNSTACAGPQTARMSVDSWQEPGAFVSKSAEMGAITGCGKLDFTPSIKVTPESSVAASPTGLHVQLTVPQQENSTKLAEADLKDAKVVLPAGMTVNPSSANGLAGCPLLSGKEAHPGVSGIDLENGEMANCPDASKVGTVHIKTPLLEEELTGGVYVAQQDANPFKSLLALYIAAEAPERGVVVKLAGHVELNAATGQLTTTFDDNPQLPFETLKLDFFGGPRAPLATPRACGTYESTALLEPWSHMEAGGTPTGTPDASLQSPYEVNSGCDPSRFSPSFTAGTTNDHGASFSPFAMTLTRKDGEQTLKTVDLTMPPGLSGMISKVTPCANAQAEAGDCPAASQIGHVVVEAGVGSEPITLPEPGKPQDPVFITEKYDGAPFGLSIVVPAEAGPFNLGTVVVRAKIYVNPHTAQVSVVSDPMPQMLQGIPLDVKAIHVSINRPEFMFNPTSCEPTSVSGTIGSAEGASSAVSSHFQAAGCAALKFKPHFSAETHAFHSRRHGAFLHVHVSSSFGQANIARVHVAIPGVLPARNDTLKLACTEEQFNKNPEGCPAGSVIGHAVAHTPVLPVPLEGKVMFVSHGSRGFPDVEVVLKGDGVTEILEGQTFINKKGQTFSTFATIPDVPIESFDMYLPEGPHSALAANGSLCRHVVSRRRRMRIFIKPHIVHGKLVKGRYVYRMRDVKSSVPVRLQMPTEITAQNGAVLHQETVVKVNGCKPQISIVAHHASGPRATIVVDVPGAGQLIADGKGVSRAVDDVKRAGRASIVVKLDRHERQLLARHPHRRLKVKVNLRFKPSHGHALESHVTVLIP